MAWRSHHMMTTVLSVGCPISVAEVLTDVLRCKAIKSLLTNKLVKPNNTLYTQ